jgi:hypothetical protein
LKNLPLFYFLKIAVVSELSQIINCLQQFAPFGINLADQKRGIVAKAVEELI